MFRCGVCVIPRHTHLYEMSASFHRTSRAGACSGAGCSTRRTVSPVPVAATPRERRRCTRLAKATFATAPDNEIKLVPDSRLLACGKLGSATLAWGQLIA
jgi:hypothetical protein